MRDQAGHRAERARGDRVQGRQRPGVHRQRRAAVPVRPGPDVGADRADLRRPPALDHRLDDRRGDRHRAAEAGHRGAGRLEGRDGQDRPDRGLAADPVDRRHATPATSTRWPRPHNAAIQRQAQIAQAQADQAAAEAQQESARNQAEYARQTAVVQAQYKAEVDRAQAEAAQAGPAGAGARPAGGASPRRPSWPSAQAELRQQQLVAEVVKPAEAEAERIRILALADAERTQIQAEAAASQQPGRARPAC